jgi:hypothetical protein
MNCKWRRPSDALGTSDRLDFLLVHAVVDDHVGRDRDVDSAPGMVCIEQDHADVVLLELVENRHHVVRRSFDLAMTDVVGVKNPREASETRVHTRKYQKAPIGLPLDDV